MAVIAIAFPVLAGKDEQVRQFGKAMREKDKEFKDSEKKLNVSKEAWFLQVSPQGSMIIVYIEANDVGKVITNFAQSKSPFDTWFKDQVKQFSGMDFNNPPSGPGPEPIVMYGY